MADPLSLLRQFNVNKKDIAERNSQIIFDEYSWPKTVKTNYLVWGSGKDGASREYYTLQCLLFFLRNVHLRHSVYMRQAAAKNIPVVRIRDRKDIFRYLNGETATSASIDKSASIEIPTQVERTAEEPQNEVVKKPCLEETQMQRAKEQFSACLDAPKEAPVVAEQIRSLSEAMSVEKIAATKAKSLFKKRTTINDDLCTADVQGILKHGVDVARDSLSPEQQWRTRATVLQSAAKPEDIPVVRIRDRKDIFRYLNGETATSANIDKSASIEIPTQVERTAEEPQNEVVKKPCLEAERSRRDVIIDVLVESLKQLGRQEFSRAPRSIDTGALVERLKELGRQSLQGGLAQ